MRGRSTRRRRTVLVAAALAMGLVASACAGDVEVTVEQAPVEVAAGPVLDPSVLSGSATTHTGESFDLSTLAGEDLVVWFWAPW